ncbi:hypothetical protein LTR95_001009 [Oleoguttula sp. CCFEE 5521]
MAPQSKIAVVTGANKGIGLAIVRNLALDYPKSPQNNGPLTIYLTARSQERGAEAVKSLNADNALQQAGVLKAGNTTITFATLDISQTKSIQSFRDFLKSQNPEGIDILINNAAVALQGFDSNVVKETLETNYYGTLEAMQDLLPLVRENGRVVNVCSMAGSLSKYSADLKQAFHDAARKDVPAVTALMEKFKRDVGDGKEKERGWPSAAYAVSKAGEIAMTKVMAGEEEGRNRGVLVNACCPGYVNTDMTKGKGTKTPDEGAKTPVMLVLQDIGGKTGLMWQSEKEVEW